MSALDKGNKSFKEFRPEVDSCREIAITPEMEAAGALAVQSSWFDLVTISEADEFRRVAKKVFLAMTEAQRE
jgi:hypothetical protein